MWRKHCYFVAPTNTHGSTWTGKTGEHFPVREKSGNFAKTGKVKEFYLKYWEDQKKNYTGKLKKKKT